MLILTRKLGETIHIGDNITCKVLDLSDKHVRIGIDAPIDVSVHREEIYRRINCVVVND